MKTGAFWQLGNVSDAQLRSDLRALLASGYRTEARIIAHIAERKLHLKDGSSSLFDYCLTTLGLSNGEAFHRMTAATIASRYPIVFSLIERREIHLTAVCMLRDYLTPENHLEPLAEASHKTKFQVQELLARRFPRPDVVSRIRKHRAIAQPAPLRNTRRGARQTSTLLPSRRRRRVWARQKFRRPRRHQLGSRRKLPFRLPSRRAPQLWRTICSRPHDLALP